MPTMPHMPINISRSSKGFQKTTRSTLNENRRSTDTQ
jgi:hypothetical protein